MNLSANEVLILSDLRFTVIYLTDTRYYDLYIDGVFALSSQSYKVIKGAIDIESSTPEIFVKLEFPF